MKLKKVRLLCVLLLIAMLACFLIGYFAQLGKSMYYVAAVFYVAFCVIYLGYWKCPHCGQRLGFGLTHSDTCPKCGKSLKQ